MTIGYLERDSECYSAQQYRAFAKGSEYCGACNYQFIAYSTRTTTSGPHPQYNGGVFVLAILVYRYCIISFPTPLRIKRKKNRRRDDGNFNVNPKASLYVYTTPELFMHILCIQNVTNIADRQTDRQRVLTNTFKYRLLMYELQFHCELLSSS